MLLPASDAVAGYQNPNLVSVSDNEGSTRYNYSLLRDYNDLNTWQKLTQNIDENNIYVPAENAEQLPGWTNKDIDLYSHKGNSLGSNIVKGLGAVVKFYTSCSIRISNVYNSFFIIWKSSWWYIGCNNRW